MINPLKGLGDLKAMRDQAMQIQQSLAQEVITIERDGVKILITGDQKIQSVMVDGAQDRRLLEALNEAIKKSQELAAKKLQEMSGGLGGLLGR